LENKFLEFIAIRQQIQSHFSRAIAGFTLSAVI